MAAHGHTVARGFRVSVDDGFPPSGRPFGSDGCHTREKEPAFDEQ
jgi:hypothetical protein